MYQNEMLEKVCSLFYSKKKTIKKQENIRNNVSLTNNTYEAVSVLQNIVNHAPM